MITVKTYLELPGVYSGDNEALGEIERMYGLTDWAAINPVLSLGLEGAIVDLPDNLEPFYDPELQTVVFRTARTEEYEEIERVQLPYVPPVVGAEELDIPAEGDEDWVPQLPPYAEGVHVRTRTIETVMAASFLRPEEVEDADADASDA